MTYVLEIDKRTTLMASAFGRLIIEDIKKHNFPPEGYIELLLAKQILLFTQENDIETIKSFRDVINNMIEKKEGAP